MIVKLTIAVSKCSSGVPFCKNADCSYTSFKLGYFWTSDESTRCHYKTSIQMNPNLIMKPWSLSHMVSSSLPAYDLMWWSFCRSQVSKAILTNWDGLSSSSNISGLNVLRSDIPMSRASLYRCSLKKSLNSVSLHSLVMNVHDLISIMDKLSLLAIMSFKFSDAVIV